MFCRFTPGANKNWKIHVKHCSSEYLRRPVMCPIRDVLDTHKAIVSHWPIFEDPKLAKCHPFFLTAKSKVTKGDPIWFTKTPVGRNTLVGITKKLADCVPSLESKRITNKTGQNTGITRLEQAHVPIDRAMALTGHRDINSYKKYNRQKREGPSSFAMQNCLVGDSGRAISYQEAMTKESNKSEEF